MDDLADAIQNYPHDRVIEKYQKKLYKHEQELARIERMRIAEKTIGLDGFQTIAGVDEVGRGPLAGRVYAAAVILPHDVVFLGINDSKKLSEKKREALFIQITSQAISYAIGYATEQEIDTMNIRNATHLAMQRAVEGLKIKPDYLLIDGNECVKSIDIPQTALIKGDSLSISIAAASIIAKVTRDRLMQALHDTYPQYDFMQNKGYGTATHMQAILTHGLCPIHRRSFTGNFVGNEHG
ncbi:MAG: ribonuclease HII [Hyphomonadaceae bacterium]|nr:ribonuclease HII [Clostridia bacterium]